jgi:UDP-glucuronate decarboxylase
MMEHPNFIGPVNLGNDTEFTVKELAELVLELTGSSSKIKYYPLPEDDPVRRRPDLSLAREKLNYKTLTPLREGLQKTITYFDKLLSKK